ncbi:MAG: hypothetical protein GF401_11210 [Chitinivibrionales bacterium]|nr:hypothetical protein [Chitinivibrionales bacterium]
MLVSIAGLKFALTGSCVGAEIIDEATAEYLGPFACTGDGDSVDFTLRVMDIHAIKMPANLQRRRYEIRYAESEGRFFFENIHARSVIDPSEKVMKASFFNPRDPQRVRLLLAQLRLLVSLLTLENHGLPIHGAALYRNNRCAIFSGPSGTGKSTIANLLYPQWGILNDECVVLRPDSDKYHAWSTPFANMNTRSRCSVRKFPVNKLFFIKQGTSLETTAMNFTQKYFSLLQSVYTLPTTREHGALAMETAESVCRSIPMETLVFPRHKETLLTIDRLL